MTMNIALSCVAVLLAVAALAVVIGRSSAATPLVYGSSLCVSAILLFAGLRHLLGGDASLSITLPLGLPWLGAHFRVDALSAFFLAVVDLGSAAASLFALGYGRHEEAPQRVLPFYPAFLAGMNLVVLADDAFTFLVSWEFMSLCSWALVMTYHRVRDNVQAGYVYLVMASFGTLALLLTFGLLAGPDGGYAFAEIRAAHPSAELAALVLILALIGAGSKAGLVPLHVWLPLAHPAAPSHVSALMSGVMTKVAVYGFVRIVFDLLGEPAWWWSMIVLALGGITAVMGVLYALMQHDLKRLLVEKVWEVVGRTALAQVLGTAEAKARNGAAGAVEEDARLTALFLWTLQSTKGEEPVVAGDEGEGEEADDEDDEEGPSGGKVKGFTLVFDVVRRFAQPLGIDLPKWEGRVIETQKGVVRLLPIAERAKQLFGEDGAQAVAARLEREVSVSNNPLQGLLFPDMAPVPAVRGRGARGRGRLAGADVSDESLASAREATTLDRVHAAMLLQAGGRTNALRALLKAEQERGPDFLRLANALSALYPKGSEEKRLLDAMLLAMPR